METTRKSVITRWTETDRKKKDNDGDSWKRSMQMETTRKLGQRGRLTVVTVETSEKYPKSHAENLDLANSTLPISANFLKGSGKFSEGLRHCQFSYRKSLGPER